MDVIDLSSHREAKKRDDENAVANYTTNEVDHFVAALIDDLQSKGVSEANAEQLVGARMSDLVLAFDLRKHTGHI